MILTLDVRESLQMLSKRKLEREITSRERDLIERARRVLPGGSIGNLYHDTVIVRGEAGRVWDVSGREYIDCLLGSGPMLVGHAHPQVVAAVQEQVERGTTFFANNEHAIELAEKVVEAVPCAQKVRFVSSGTEAIQYAIRTARAHRKRDYVMKLEGGFHGMSDHALMSVTPQDPPDYPKAVADSAGISRSIPERTLIAPFNDIERTTALIARHHDLLGCVVAEPFQRLIPPQPGFLESLREVTSRYQVPLIFDEVVTGFRFAYGGAQEYYGVVPDLCALGKVLAGGFPLAAIAGREDLMSHFDPTGAREDFLPQIGTLSGNPVACAAGLATLEILREPGTYESLFASGKRIKDGLQQCLDEAGIAAHVIGEPLVFDVFFSASPPHDYRSSMANDTPMLRRFNQLLLEYGVLKGDSKFYISTAHTEQDIECILQAFAKVIDRLKEEALTDTRE